MGEAEVRVPRSLLLSSPHLGVGGSLLHPGAGALLRPGEPPLRPPGLPPLHRAGRNGPLAGGDHPGGEALVDPTGFTTSLSGIVWSGCFTTTCTSTRREARTTRNSTTLPPPPRASARRSSLSSTRKRGRPFTCSLHHLPLCSASGGTTIDAETSGISMDLHLCRGLNRGKPGLAPSAHLR